MELKECPFCGGRTHMAEEASTGKRVLTEMEEQIIDMWPRFEDGDPLWFGDLYVGAADDILVLSGVMYDPDGASMVSEEGFHDLLEDGERVKRPFPSVLDADGVEIEVGDTVYERNGKPGTVTAVHPEHGCVDLDQGDCYARAMDGLRLTHTRPDSWERLEEDAGEHPFAYCKAAGIHLYTFDNSELAKSRDIIRRAKALAGVE